MAKYREFFTFSLSDINQTDLPIISVTDSRTGFVVRTALSNNSKQIPSIMAFAGARFSRSSDTAENIFGEIKNSGKSAQEKLAAIFRGYGHASVADMAQLMVYIENVPMIYEAKFFYETSVGGGQARSTRFQNFDNPDFVNLGTFVKGDFQNKASLETEFENLQKYSLAKYNYWVERLTAKYIEVYQVDINDKKQLGALKARVFDSARYFLLSGLTTRTSLAWITSAREWARIISIFKGSPDQNLQYLAEQLETLLAPDPEFAETIGYLPEAPDLIRYTTADETTSNNLRKLQEYLETINFFEVAKVNTTFGFHPIGVDLYGEKYPGSLKAIAQNILSIYPNVDISWLMEWLLNQESTTKTQLSQVLFAGYNHHQQMGNQFRTNVQSYVLTCSIAEARDFNRHRAWGRFTPILSTDTSHQDIINDGYTLPLYLTQNPQLSAERIEFEKDLLGYYDLLKNFLEQAKPIPEVSMTLIWELLPFAHIMKFWMHGSPKEISYMTKLRVRPGGHINYRLLAWQMAELSATSDPFLAAIDLGTDQKPDANSRDEFLDRS